LSGIHDSVSVAYYVDVRFSNKAGRLPLAGQLVDKLKLKAGYRAAVLSTPDGKEELLSPIPEGVELHTSLDGTYDFIVSFVRNRSDIDTWGAKVITAAREDAVIWFAYPKVTSGLFTDINRDTGWDAVRVLHWRPVSQVAIDETWSALRFRPEAKVK
jgi:hypothetical protein